MISAKSTGSSFKCKGGLQNLGNTCYLNTSLQCLLHCNTFLNFFLKNNGHHECPLFNQLKDVFYKLHILNKCVVPKGLIFMIERTSISNILDIKSPNDMHEFLSLFLDVLLEEQKKREKTDFHHFKNIMIGKNQNCIICDLCRDRSLRNEDFSSIMLSFHKQEHESCELINLNEMICRAFQDEHIEKRECDGCSSKQNAVKYTKLYKLPHVLILMIKRYDLKGKRINSGVNVPYSLDLKPLIIRPWKLKGDQGDSDDQEKERLKYTKYEIRSIACHIGSQQNGHYYSLCHDTKNKIWWKIDDEKAEQIEILPHSRDYYCLFYEKIK